MQRRRMLAAVPAVAVGALTAGCLDVLTEETMEYESQPVAVAEAVATQEGYELENRDEFVIDEEADVPVLGTRRVLITNHIANYSVAGADEQVTGLLVASSPKAEVAGQGVNPLGRVPLEDLIDQIDEGEAGDSDVEEEEVESTEIRVLGSDAEVQKIPSTTETDDGQEIETYVYVTRVANEDDYIISVGMLPRQLEAQESSVYAMMEGIEHPVSL